MYIYIVVFGTHLIKHENNCFASSCYDNASPEEFAEMI
jgi:hypothetical protein